MDEATMLTLEGLPGPVSLGANLSGTGTGLEIGSNYKP
jgi:hypothetical protein